MRKQGHLACAGAALVALATLAGANGTSAAEVDVYRGTTMGAAAESFVETRFGVTELRGTMVSAAEAQVVDAVAPAAETVLVAAGSRLWIYRPQVNKVVLCRIHRGGRTGPGVPFCEKAGGL